MTGDKTVPVINFKKHRRLNRPITEIKIQKTSAFKRNNDDKQKKRRQLKETMSAFNKTVPIK
jgi:hypothetical protein